MCPKEILRIMVMNTAIEQVAKKDKSKVTLKYFCASLRIEGPVRLKDEERARDAPVKAGIRLQRDSTYSVSLAGLDFTLLVACTSGNNDGKTSVKMCRLRRP